MLAEVLAAAVAAAAVAAAVLAVAEVAAAVVAAAVMLAEEESGGSSGGIGHGRGNGVAQGRGNAVAQGRGNGVAQGRGNGVAQGRGNGVAQGRGNGVAKGRGNGVAKGRGNGVAQGRGNGVAKGRGNGVAKGRGNGTAHGGGLGFGHPGVGNQGHNTLSTRSSHSQNTSHKGGTQDGRSFPNQTISMRSLAQHHTPPDMDANQADQVPDVAQVPQVNQPLQVDQGPRVDGIGEGEKKGFVDSLPPGQELQAEGGRLLNLEPIHSDPGDIAISELPLDLELNLDRGKPLQVSWPAKVAPGIIVPDADDTPATELPRQWVLGDGRAEILRSIHPELDDDDEKWKFVPYFGAVLLFFSWILQSLSRRVTKGKVASVKFEPNAFRSIGSVNGEEPCEPYGVRPAALVKKETLLEHFSGDPHVEEARAEIEDARKIKETFVKGFDGIGLG